MKVAINCRSFLTKQPTGIGRYAYHLVKSLAAVDQENDYQLYARPGLFRNVNGLLRCKAQNFTLCSDRFGRGPAAVLKKPDLYHEPSPGPWEAPTGVPAVVTVHDVIIKAYPQGHTRETIDSGERYFKDIVRNAAKIICCSQNTRNDLQNYFSVPPGKMAMVYQGVDKEIFYPLGEDERPAAEKMIKDAGVDRDYLLSVGTIEPRKNLVNVIRAFHLLKTGGKFNGRLVVVGMKGWLHSDVGKVVSELGLEREILFLGYVPDRLLRYLYTGARAFVFPSFYEGFGFPIVEAFCCEVPVVTSDRSACPEIAADAALTVDPGDEVKIAAATEQILEDPGLCADLIRKGRQRAEDFDFRKTAQETLNIYKEVHAK